jgi:hypothetical protein
MPFYPGGKIPTRGLSSFSELNEYCDANQLGGLCGDEFVAAGNRLFSGRSDTGTVATQDWMLVSNRIQALADEWLLTAGEALRGKSWRYRMGLVGKYREVFRSFGPLDIEVPIGWWDASSYSDGCPKFDCGNYRLWVEHKDISAIAARADTPRFTLELLDYRREHVRVVFASNDWIEMQACLFTLPPSRDYLAWERPGRRSIPFLRSAS